MDQNESIKHTDRPVEAHRSRDVALVLSSGGPRGFAYIGAIEELEARGYRITSIAGSSVGSLVGGIYAAGGLQEFKEWLFSLDHFKVMSLMDIAISKRYLVKGERVINAIKEVVPNVAIESLPIPYCAIATDLYTGEEIVFRDGPLFEAVRASISIPSMFRPVKWRHRTLVDGGMVNTFPLDRVSRSGHDLLVGFNVNAVDAPRINAFLEERFRLGQAEARTVEAAKSVLADSLSLKGTLLERVREVGARGERLVKERIQQEDFGRKLLSDSHKQHIPTAADDNYYTILDRSFSIMNHSLARLALRTNPPDILVEMPFDAYTAISDYGRGAEIAERGRKLMAEALDQYENTAP